MEYNLAIMVAFFFTAWVVALKLRIARLERRIEELGGSEAPDKESDREGAVGGSGLGPRQSGVPTWHID